MNKVLVTLIAASAGLSSAAFATDKLTATPATSVTAENPRPAAALKYSSEGPAQLTQVVKKDQKKKKPKLTR